MSKFKEKSAVFLILSLAHLCSLAEVTPPKVEPSVEMYPTGKTDSKTLSIVFPSAMLAIGATRPDPGALNCNKPNIKLKGTWKNPTTWEGELSQKLSPGDYCTWTPAKDLKDLLNSSVRVKSQYSIQGPSLTISVVTPSNTITPDQVFIARANDLIDESSLAANTWCQIDTTAEKVPVALDPSALKALQKEGLAYSSDIAFRCQQKLPYKSKLSLVINANVAAKNNSAFTTASKQIFKYSVASPFTANVSCTRPSPGAPCDPFSAITVSFSEPIPAQVAQKIVLKQGPLTIKPTAEKNSESQASFTNSVEFAAPLPEASAYQLVLPSSLKSLEGNVLSNEKSFPLTIKIGSRGPLVKFSGSFGILESKEGGVLPLSVRRVEKALKLSGTVVSNDVATSAEKDEQKIALLLDKFMTFNSKYDNTDMPGVDNRKKSFLKSAGISATSSKPLPNPSVETSGDLEVVGLELGKPGFYIVEASSDLLGKELLAKNQPMYVRTSALVTNLGVHVKAAASGGLVWVTALDTGAPVSGAKVSWRTCSGSQRISGTTDKDGLFKFTNLPNAASKGCMVQKSDIVFAQKDSDISFSLLSWSQGLEEWRYNLENSTDYLKQYAQPFDGIKIKTVFDRVLLRRTETLHLHNIARNRQLGAFVAMPAKAKLPATATIQHIGSGDKYTINLSWTDYNESSATWTVPEEAKLGMYQFITEGSNTDAESEGTYFTVGEYKLPAFISGLQLSTQAENLKAIGSLNYLSSGPAKGQKVEFSVASSESGSYIDLPEHSPFRPYSFYFYADKESIFEKKVPELRDALRPDCADKIIAENIEKVLDENGQSVLTFKAPTARTSCEYTVEMKFFDPSGQVSTKSATIAVHPTKFVVGSKINSPTSLQLATLDRVSKKPVSNVKFKIYGFDTREVAYRKKIVGGFYSYSRDKVEEPLGVVCEGVSSADGTFQCNIKKDIKGSLILVLKAQSPDGQYTVSQLDMSYHSWESPTDDNRMTLEVDKSEYSSGESAKIVPKVSFENAWMLVTKERANILNAKVVNTKKANPTIDVDLSAEDGPNVYVSVFAVRGRVASEGGVAVPAPTGLIDLGKPAFRLGLTELKVASKEKKLTVAIAPQKEVVKPRDTASVTLKVSDYKGRPVKGAHLTFAAVDQALDLLKENNTYAVYDQFYTWLPYAVITATNQNQIVGKRHYGKKAAASGGGGGNSLKRELFDPVVHWSDTLVTNEEGLVTVKIKLNDSISNFNLIATATKGQDMFGHAKATIATFKDIQMRATLPAYVRPGDKYFASVTVLNATKVQKTLKLSAVQDSKELDPQTIVFAPGQSKEVGWTVSVPEDKSNTPITWSFKAESSVLEDSLEVKQKVYPSRLAEKVQGDFIKLDLPYSMDIEQPSELVGPSLFDAQISNSALEPGKQAVKEFFDKYPYSCAEQQTSKALGYMDKSKFDALMKKIPGYMSDDGLVNYFPVQGSSTGSAHLTAYILTSAKMAGWAIPEAQAEKMLKGLISHVAQSKKANYLMGDFLIYQALAQYNKLDLKEFLNIQTPIDRLSNIDLAHLYTITREYPILKHPLYNIADIRKEVKNRLMPSGSFRTGTYYWFNSNLFAQALILINVAQDEEMKELALPISIALSESTSKTKWSSTVNMAWTSLALNKAATLLKEQPQIGELTLKVGQAISKYNWEQKEFEQFNAKLSYDSSGKVQVSNSTKTKGPVYMRYSVYQTKKNPTPVSKGFEISKKYEVITKGSSMSSLKRGDIVKVTLTLETSKPIEMVALKDPVPSGMRFMPEPPLKVKEQDCSCSWLWPTFEEMGDGYYIGYFSQVTPLAQERGKNTVVYFLSVTTPGVYKLPPTQVEAMYDPAMFGQTAPSSIEVK